MDNNFWVDVKFVVQFVEPICDMLHYENIVGPCLGDIYENMDSTCERMKSITNPKDPTLWSQLKSFINGKWSK